MAEKRPRDTDNEEAPPAKRARAATIYTVTYTKFLDDYKARGNDWSDTTTLGSFRSKTRAYKRRDNKVFELVRERLADFEGDPEYAKYWEYSNDDDDDEDSPPLNAKRVREDLVKLEKRLVKGEFVPVRFSVDVECASFDDRSSSEES